MTGTSPEYHFAIHLDPHHRLRLALHGMTAEHSMVTLTDELLMVRAGTWSMTVPLGQVAAARVVDPDSVSMGVHHHAKGRWTVAGDTGRSMLRIDLDEAAGRLIPRVTTLDVGLDDPDAFLRRLVALRPELAAAG